MNAAILDMRMIVSTPAVLADAWEHGFVKMGKLALLVFDEGMGIPKRTTELKSNEGYSQPFDHLIT